MQNYDISINYCWDLRLLLIKFLFSTRIEQNLKLGRSRLINWCRNSLKYKRRLIKEIFVTWMKLANSYTTSSNWFLKELICLARLCRKCYRPIYNFSFWQAILLKILNSTLTWSLRGMLLIILTLSKVCIRICRTSLCFDCATLEIFSNYISIIFLFLRSNCFSITSFIFCYLVTLLSKHYFKENNFYVELHRS